MRPSTVGFVLLCLFGCSSFFLCDSVFWGIMDNEVSLVLEDAPEVYVALESRCLAGKVIADKKMNCVGINNIIRASWKTKGGFKLTTWGDNVFSVSFDRPDDARRIESEGPWSVMGFTVVLKLWEIDKQISEVNFAFCKFWIQIHNLPINKRSKNNIHQIASLAGEVIEVEELSPSVLADLVYIRARVLVDVRKPLMRGFKLWRNDKDFLWATFRYERLSNHCSFCGMLGHEKDSCKNHAPEDGDVEPFGAWMRGFNTRKVFGEKQGKTADFGRNKVEKLLGEARVIKPPDSSGALAVTSGAVSATGVGGGAEYVRTSLNSDRAVEVTLERQRSG